MNFLSTNDSAKHQYKYSKESFHDESCKVQFSCATSNSSDKKSNLLTDDFVSTVKFNKNTQTEVIEKSDKIIQNNLTLAALLNRTNLFYS